MKNVVLEIGKEVCELCGANEFSILVEIQGINYIMCKKCYDLWVKNVGIIKETLAEKVDIHNEK